MTQADSTNAAYAHFMRPEPSKTLGPIRLEYDTVFGREVKTRLLKIGMTRNAAEENQKEFKAYLEPYPHIRIDKAKPLQGWYKGLNEKNGVRNRPCFTEALLAEPYGGWCPVGCLFCYVNSGMRGYRGTGLVTVPTDYAGQIKKQLANIRRGSAVYFTPFADPFVPLEDYYHNTQLAAEECIAVGLPIFFLSRLRYPDWAIKQLQKSPYSYAQKSINTTDPRDWKILSPGSLGIEEHLQDIRRLKKAGIYVSIQCNPIIPGVITHEHVKELFRRLGAAGADHVIVKFAEAGYSWAKVMEERMIQRFGARGEAFASLFTDNIGGQRSVAEEYRLQAHRRYQKWATKYGLTYSVCYEYRYERDETGKVINKTGVSIGREVTTSAQCHGHRVPCFTRNSGEEPFKPVRKCPSSGCLYCAEENNGVPRCGDTLAGKAVALRLPDLRKPIKDDRKNP